MPDLNERVTRLEERSDAQTRLMEHLRADISDLRNSVEVLRSDLRESVEALRTELRTELSGFRADVRQDFAEVRRTIDRIDRRFTWLVGILVTGFIAVIGALAGAFYR
jgi:uncharacterized coiled-coil protein SlyX